MDCKGMHAVVGWDGELRASPLSPAEIKQRELDHQEHLAARALPRRPKEGERVAALEDRIAALEARVAQRA